MNECQTKGIYRKPLIITTVQKYSSPRNVTGNYIHAYFFNKSFLVIEVKLVEFVVL
jgi:hypothetical protein